MIWSSCLLFYSQELKIHLDDFTFGMVLLQKIKASELHLLGQASHPPSLKITNPNVNCLCWFSQKANRMLHSQCPCTSVASKQPTPERLLARFWFSSSAERQRGQEMSCCYSPFIQKMERLSGCQLVSANKSPLQTLSDESQCENFLHMNCFARKAPLFSEQIRKRTT